MKQSFLFFFGVFAFTAHLFSAPVSRQKAERIAIATWQKDDDGAWPGKTYPVRDYLPFPFGESPAIHVFRFDSQGMVIIAADDRVPPVLALTHKAGKSLDDIPPALKAHLKNWILTILYCQRNDIPATDKIRKAWEAASQPADHAQLTASLNAAPPLPPIIVSPLLSTQWNQGCNYNADLPSATGGPCGRAWTGCGATALAQILKYNAHPASGFGTFTHTYAAYPPQTANFGSTSYNYGAMPNTLGSANAEVAQLMHHCGIALQMQYGPSVSNCYFTDLRSALKQYFRYTLDLKGWSKFLYSNTEWDSLLRGELNAGRPLPYSGGSHFWVLDGYRTAPDLYHMNWGWGGTYDGWYALSNLNPGSLSFSTVAAIGNIQPAAPLEISPASLSYAAGGGNQTVEVAVDSIWTVTSPASWLTLSMSGAADGYYQITVSATANPGYSPRSSFLAFARGSLRDTVWVDQDGITPTLNVTPATISEGYGGGSHSLTVSSDSVWTVIFADAWLTYAPGSGVGAGTISLGISSNASPAPRSGMLVLARGAMRDTLWLDQAGNTGTWCVPIVPVPTTVGASRVRVHTLDRSSGISEGFVLATDSTTLWLDSSYTLTVDFTGGVAPAIWIDWNADGDFFDAGEAIVPPSGPWYPTFGGSKSVSVNVPASALPGETRMRVYVKSFPSPASGPCDSLNVGDIEDYRVFIIDGAAPLAVSSIVLSGELQDNGTRFTWDWQQDQPPVGLELMHWQNNRWELGANLVSTTNTYQSPERLTGQFRLRARMPEGELAYSNVVEIQSEDTFSWTLSPVPVTQGAAVSLTLPPQSDKTQLELIDASGKILIRRHFEPHTQPELQTNGLSPGLYWVRLKTGGKSSVKQLIVQ